MLIYLKYEQMGNILKAKEIGIWFTTILRLLSEILLEYDALHYFRFKENNMKISVTGNLAFF